MTLPLIGVCCVAAALSLPDSHPAALAAMWGLLVVEEAVWWWPVRRTPSNRSRSAAAVSRAAVDQPMHPVDEENEDESLLAADVTQQLTRSRNAAGREVISGLLRAEFAPGERLTNLHLAFCPPLDYEPRVTAQQLDGPMVVIQVRQAESFGARLEVRLGAELPQPQSVAIVVDVQPPDNTPPGPAAGAPRPDL